jgi:hypothetical protein
LPGTLNSIQLEGEAVWCRCSYKEQTEPFHLTGIRFTDLVDPNRSLIRDYTLRMLSNREVVQDQGITNVLNDIRNLPAMDRLKAYNILIKKGAGPLSLR